MTTFFWFPFAVPLSAGIVGGAVGGVVVVVIVVVILVLVVAVLFVKSKSKPATRTSGKSPSLFAPSYPDHVSLLSCGQLYSSLLQPPPSLPSFLFPLSSKNHDNNSPPAVYEQMQSPFPDESLSSANNPMYMGPDKVVGDRASHMGTLSRNFANPLYQDDEEDSEWSMHGHELLF